MFSGSVQWITPENVCTAPQNLMTTNIGFDFANLSWGAVGGTEHYRVRYREVGSNQWLFRDFIGNTFTTIPNLFPNVTYESQVQSECTLGATDWSNLITFTTTQIPTCDPPQNLFASMITVSSAKHNWDPVVGALEYIMRRRVLGSQTWVEFTTTENFIPTYALAANTHYEFQVKTTCTVGDSPFSGSAFYTTDDVLPCAAPTNLMVDDITPSSADFDWSDVTGVLTYQMEWRIQGTSNWSSVTTTSSHISRTGLTPASTYEWRVGAKCNSGGTYTFSTIETFQTAAVNQCTTPNGLFVLGIGQTQATLTWGSIPEANNYDARIRPTGSTTWTNLPNITSNLKVVFGLLPATECEWQVRSNCLSGASSYSGSDTFTTQASSDASTNSDLEGFQLASTSSHARKPTLYPNPATSGQINIEMPGTDENLHLVIRNIAGQMVANLVIAQQKQKIDLNNLGIHPGIYGVVAVSKSGEILMREKLIIQ